MSGSTDQIAAIVLAAGLSRLRDDLALALQDMVTRRRERMAGSSPRCDHGLPGRPRRPA